MKKLLILCVIFLTVLSLNLIKSDEPTYYDEQANSLLEEVTNELILCDAEVEKLYTPFALGWSLLGLGAWKERPSNAQALIYFSLLRQQRYGPYNTSLLSLLLLAFTCENGLLNNVMI